jgi:hypothetical protein
MQLFEYKMLLTFNAPSDMQHSEPAGTRNPGADLNGAAEQGWELFQVVAFPHAGGMSVCHYMRRPKEQWQSHEATLAEMSQ